MTRYYFIVAARTVQRGTTLGTTASSHFQPADISPPIEPISIETVVAEATTETTLAPLNATRT